MSVWGTNPAISGYKYPGSHILPEDAEDDGTLERVPDAVYTSVANMDEGCIEEVTSRFLRLSVVADNDYSHEGVDVLLDVYGARQLMKQLRNFIKWRKQKEARS